MQEFPAVTPYQRTFGARGRREYFDGLHLILDKQFPEIATKLIKKYGPLINKVNYEILGKLLRNPNDKSISRSEGEVIWTQVGKHSQTSIPAFDEDGGFLRIKLKEKLLLSGQKEKKIERPVDLLDLPWEQSKKEFQKKYYIEAKKRNPELTDSELAKKINVSRQTISKWKAEFTQ